ncbi:alpha/beta hydrolase [Streptomyces sp. NPDC048361]|uniref:alpha/beta fold hydrolase n=1 Tax=Streptomyces sp. NPDC048361 TaxID=3154720 RepID=UPI00343CDC15
MFLRVGGVPHHVVVEGAGPVVVLSAGLGMSWFDWDPVVPLLAPHHTVVRFDRPGHGLSGPALVPPSAAGEAHRIAGILDALGAAGPATVVGHSIAGFHAEAFARLYPARAAGLVLVDSSVEEHARPPAAAGLRLALARALGSALCAAGAPAALGPAARRATVRMSRTGGGDPAQRELVRGCYRTSRVLRGMVLENARYHAVAAELLCLRREFALSAGRRVVLAGGAGGARWVARQQGLAGALGAAFLLAEGAGHLVMLDAPARTAEAISPTPPLPETRRG